jgi:hypothetical protein
MIFEQAEQLAKRVINTWRLTPTLREWQEVLAGLDYDGGLVTFKRLRAEVDGGLSIKRFLDAYHDRERQLFEERERRIPPSRCEECGGSGWIPATPAQAHYPPACAGTPGQDDCHCQAVVPCRCSAGRHADVIVAKIEEGRAAMRRQLGELLPEGAAANSGLLSPVRGATGRGPVGPS